MRQVTATTKGGKSLTVNTNLTLDQAVKVLEEIKEWNSFASRLLQDYDTYGERLFDSTKDWMLIVAQQHLDRKRDRKSVTLGATARFFQASSPNVGTLVFTEIPMGDYALQLFANAQGKKDLVRVRRRRLDTKDREYLGTIQPDGVFVTTKATEEEVGALKKFNRKPVLTGTASLAA